MTDTAKHVYASLFVADTVWINLASLLSTRRMDHVPSSVAAMHATRAPASKSNLRPVSHRIYVYIRSTSSKSNLGANTFHIIKCCRSSRADRAAVKKCANWSSTNSVATHTSSLQRHHHIAQHAGHYLPPQLWAVPRVHAILAVERLIRGR